ncbi:MAG: putative ATPase [Eubacterium sp.]|jgi:predicted ATPase|nr:putative ATPase [Eubacterium sp.]
MFSELFISGMKFQKDEEVVDNYFFELPSLKNIEHLSINKKVTFLVGENGSGKSTLLEAIAVNMGFNAEGGTRNFNFASQETHSTLYRHMTVIKGIRRPKDGFFLRAESFYNVASEVDRLDKAAFNPFIHIYGGKSLHNQSHGESFMSLVLNRFKGDSLYLFDEPEAALSPTRQLSLLVHINELVKNNSQFIIATHSPILMAYPGAEILMLDDNGIKSVPYEETEHYVVTKQFLNNPGRMLDYLFNDKGE